MKKILALIMALTMAVLLIACSNGNVTASSSAAATTQAPSASASTATAATTAPATQSASATAAASDAGPATTDVVANSIPLPSCKDYSKIKIAYACSSLTNEIFAMQVNAMTDYCKKIGVQFEYKASEAEADKISAIENFIQKGENVIMVHVTDTATFQNSMKETQAAGIKFFSYDTAIPGCDSYYGWDNYKYGWAIGENAAKWVNATFASTDTVNAVSCNYPSLNFLKVREQGYKDALAKLAPNVKWVAEGLGGLASNGVTSGENFLQMGKTINLVVGINDAGCLGVLQSFQAAKYGNDKVGIFAGDAVDDALKAISSGTVFRGTVTTGLVSEAPDFINICVDLANGGKGGFYNGPTAAITKDNVANYLKK